MQIRAELASFATLMGYFLRAAKDSELHPAVKPT